MGFAYRARNVIIGIDAIKKRKILKNDLVLVSEELAENSLKKISTRKIVLKRAEWQKVIFAEGIKAILVTDKNINRVIIDCFENRDEV